MRKPSAGDTSKGASFFGPARAVGHLVTHTGGHTHTHTHTHTDTDTHTHTQTQTHSNYVQSYLLWMNHIKM